MSRIDVLIVEDNPAERDLLSYLLRAFGADVRTAGNGTDGLTLARERCPDVVLTDLRMPPLDGFALAAAMQADPSTRAAVRIAVTSLDRLERSDDALLAEGFASVMRKPIDAEGLLQAVVGGLDRPSIPA